MVDDEDAEAAAVEPEDVDEDEDEAEGPTMKAVRDGEGAGNMAMSSWPVGGAGSPDARGCGAAAVGGSVRGATRECEIMLRHVRCAMNCRRTVQRRRGPLSLLRGTDAAAAAAAAWGAGDGGGQRRVRVWMRDGHAGEGVRVRGEDDGCGHARRLRGGEGLRGRVGRDGLREGRERCCFRGRVSAGGWVLCAGEGHARTCGGRARAC